MNPPWLRWMRELQAIAQTGLTYTKDPYDSERYAAIRRIAAEIGAAHSTLAFQPIEALFAGELGHATPKVDVRGALFRGDEILLVRERGEGLWTLPGGWVDVGEPPSVAVTREFREESGYPVRAIKLAMLQDRELHNVPPHPFHIYKLFFLCERIEEQPVQLLAADDAEISGVDFFVLTALPPLSVGRVTQAQIERLLAHHQHPEWPSDFD